MTNSFSVPSIASFFLIIVHWGISLVSAVPVNNDLWRVTTPWMGTLSLNKAQSNQLITLTFVPTTSTNDRIPIARSYDGRDWELSPGLYTHIGLAITCSGSSCGINLSNLTRSGDLFETSYTSPFDPDSGKGKNTRAARFLEQAT